MANINSNTETAKEEIPSIKDAAPQTTTALSVTDIVQLLNFIDVASRRGAFQAAEMSAIGSTYDKVLTFLKASGAISESKSEIKE